MIANCSWASLFRMAGCLSPEHHGHYRPHIIRHGRISHWTWAGGSLSWCSGSSRVLMPPRLISRRFPWRHRGHCPEFILLLVRGVVEMVCQAFPTMNPRPTLPAFHPLRLAILRQEFWGWPLQLSRHRVLTASPGHQPRVSSKVTRN